MGLDDAACDDVADQSNDAIEREKSAGNSRTRSGQCIEEWREINENRELP